jgi:hypothetical protein
MNDIGTDENALAADLLRGAKAIGSFIGESEKRVFYLAERGHLPVGRIGATLVASKKALRAHFEQLTQAVVQPAPRPRRAPPPRRGRRRDRADQTAA